LDSKGKCHNCQDKLFPECYRCKFISKGNNEKLVCSLCKEGFYLDDNGNCVKFVAYLEKIPNCYEHIYQIDQFSIYYINDNNMHYMFYNNETNDYNYFYYSNHYDEKILDYINSNIKKINNTIKGKCISCSDVSILNSDNICAQISIENCSIFLMIKYDLSSRC